MLITNRDSTVMTRSDRWYCRIAPHAPTTTPITVPTTGADDQQSQADADAPPQFVRHRLSADGGAEVAVYRAGHPVAVADRDRLVEVQLGGLGVDHGLRRPRIALQQAVQRLELLSDASENVRNEATASSTM